MLKRNKKAFSSVLIIIIVWILIMLVSWVFNLILRELKDNRWLWSYLKSYAAAEWAQELMLLKIKENWYWYDDKIDNTVNDRSILLSSNPTDISKFNWWNDPFISYYIDSKTNDYSWSINSNWYDILPLFYKDDSWIYKVNDVTLNINTWNQADLVWNIVWEDSWVSWTWSFDRNYNVKIKTFTWWAFIIEPKNLWDFLLDSSNNYLVLFNSSSSDITYDLKSVNTLEYFSKPRAQIFSSAQVWWYMQNLRTDLDNTEYLWMLKYSVFSN